MIHKKAQGCLPGPTHDYTLCPRLHDLHKRSMIKEATHPCTLSVYVEEERERCLYKHPIFIRDMLSGDREYACFWKRLPFNYTVKLVLALKQRFFLLPPYSRYLSTSLWQLQWYVICLSTKKHSIHPRLISERRDQELCLKHKPSDHSHPLPDTSPFLTTHPSHN